MSCYFRCGWVSIWCVTVSWRLCVSQLHRLLSVHLWPTVLLQERQMHT